MIVELEFRYALVNRPAGIGCVPRGLSYDVRPRPNAGEAHHAMARHGVMVTRRPLTNEELAQFEIAPMVSVESMPALAKRLMVGSLGWCAREYLDVRADDPEVFRQGVLQSLERLDRGVRWSIESEGALLDVVAAELSKAVEAG